MGENAYAYSDPVRWSGIRRSVIIPLFYEEKIWQMVKHSFQERW